MGFSSRSGEKVSTRGAFRNRPKKWGGGQPLRLRTNREKKRKRTASVWAGGFGEKGKGAEEPRFLNIREKEKTACTPHLYSGKGGKGEKGQFSSLELLKLVGLKKGKNRRENARSPG